MRLKLPEVTVTGATASPKGATPVLVVVDEQGKLAIAAGREWSELATFDPAKATPVDRRDDARKAILLAFEDGLTSTETVALYKESGQPAMSMNGAVPEADHRSMALDEGKMGKNAPAKSERAARAEAAGGFGARDHSFELDPHDPKARHADVVGEVVDALEIKQPAVVLAHPHAKATALIAAVSLTQGLIGVSSAGRVVPLRIQFLYERGGRDEPHWTEIAVTSTTDADTVTKAFAAATHDNVYAPVDLIVAPDVDVQRLIDVAVELESAGARVIGLGAAK